MKTRQLQIVTWKEGRQYVAQCLNVGVSSFGATKKQALHNITEALNLYFEDVSLSKAIDIQQPEVVKLQVVHA